MDQTDFQAAFEEFVPGALQCAYDCVDGDDRVETIWIVGIRDGDWSMGNVRYKVSGVITKPRSFGELIPGLDDTNEHWDEADPATLGLARLLLEAGVRAENPTRVVIRYDVASQSVNADFTYEKLHREPDDTLAEVAQRWYDRLKTTGNDAAAD